MAEAENTDVEDPYLRDLKVFPSRLAKQEFGSTAEKKVKDMRKRGFNKLRVVVIEAAFGNDCKQGSGVLCSLVDDWPEFGEEVDELRSGYDFQWVLTAAHCVSIKKRSKCMLPEKMRVRIPKYKQWPSKKLKDFEAGPYEAYNSKRFKEVVYSPEDISKHVHVYEPYTKYFSSEEGEDFALIQIPIHKSDLPPNTFQVWDKRYKPLAFSIVGFPAEADKAYLPYFDRRREAFGDFDISPRDPEHLQVYYTSSTSGGQSGGPVQFLNVDDNYRAVVGIHVTGKVYGEGEASACMITKKISEWVDNIQKNAAEITSLPSNSVSTPFEKVEERKKQQNQKESKAMQDREETSQYCFTVKGCGTDEFNGNFFVDIAHENGFRHGKRCFRKKGVGDAGSECVIYHYHGNGWWYMKKRYDGALYYSVKSDADLPPTSGWMVDSAGSGSPPQLEYGWGCCLQ